MKKDKLTELSLTFTKMCIEISNELKLKKETSFADQIKRSSSSICANLAEGSHPQSRLDMISKFEIALKEAFESDRWLQIFYNSKLISNNTFNDANKICTKIRILLIASIKTLKSKL